MMKIRHSLSALLLILCFQSLPAQGQTYVSTPVTISKEKVKVGDKTYYSHVVLEKQTLYSIAKTYGVSVEDIYAANTDLDIENNGLKKNSIIRIPINDGKDDTSSKDEKTGVVKEEKTAKAQSAESDAPEVSSETKIHTVKWYEDIQGIAAKYGVSVESIMKANNLSDTKLKARMKLIIPLNADGESSTVDSNQTVGNTTSDNTVTIEEENAPKINTDLTFALILPLKAASGMANNNYMDFYSGALLASYNAQARGINVDLSVYDDATTLPAFTSGRLSMFDAIIGPVGADNMESLLKKAPDGCTVVSPLDSKTGALCTSYENLCQANADSGYQYADIASWIAEDLEGGDRVLMIYEKSKTELRNRMDSLLRKQGLSYSELSYNILEGRTIESALASKMTNSACNRVVIASESEAFVNDVIRNLNVAVYGKYNIAVYGPSKFKTFETIDIDYIHNVNLHLSLSYNIDYTSDEVRKFLMDYRAIFGTEPTAFAFQGYDLTNYFVDAISAYGDKWRKYRVGKTAKMLQSDIRFEKVNGKKGYTNTALRRVIYGPNYTIVNVK